MPGGDSTGPIGNGPLSGRAMGNCRGAVMDNRGFGRGRGMGMGNRFGNNAGFGRRLNRPVAGRGWAMGPVNTTPEQEKSFLKDEIDYLENSLKIAKSRLNSVGNDPDKS